MTTIDRSYQQPSSSLPIFTIVSSGLIGILVVLIIIYVGITGIKNTANQIMVTTANGTRLVEGIAKSLVSQSQSVVESSYEQLTVAAENSLNFINNGVTLIFNTISSIGEGFLNWVTMSLQKIVDMLVEFSETVVTFFLSTVGAILALVETFYLQPAVQQAYIVEAMFGAVLDPVKLIIAIITDPSSVCG